MLIAKVVPTTLNNWCQNELATPTGCFDKWTIVFLNKVKSLYKFAKTAGAKAIGFPLASCSGIGNNYEEKQKVTTFIYRIQST